MRDNAVSWRIECEDFVYSEYFVTELNLIIPMKRFDVAFDSNCLTNGKFGLLYLVVYA